MKNNRTGWLEDFDPTASGSRTSTRQRLARGLGPVPGWVQVLLELLFSLTRARARYRKNELEDLDPSTRGTIPGHYNEEIQRGNKTGKQKKNEKTKKIEKSNL